MQRVHVDSGSDLPIGYSLGPQDPRGPPKNCGTHRVNGRYMIMEIFDFVKNVCLNYYSRNLVSFNFRGDNARVFQRVSMMGVSKESISKFLIGNRFHVKLRILSPYSNTVDSI